MDQANLATSRRSDAAVRARTPVTVSLVDLDHFIELVLGEFKALHPGNAIRFGIRPLELAAWQDKHLPKDSHAGAGNR